MNSNALPQALHVLKAAFLNNNLFPPMERVLTQQEIQQVHLEQVERESSTRQDLDKLLKNWIFDKHEFSLDNSATSNLIRARFSEAKHFAEFLIHNGFQTSDHSLESLLQFLLTEYWAQHGVLRFRERLKPYGV